MSSQPLPDHLRAPFHISQARESGIPSSRLRRRDLIVPARGVRALRPAATLLERARQLAVVLPDGALISHQTAALILQLPLPRRLDRGELHVTTPRHTPAIRRRGVIGHRGAELRTRHDHAGVPLTSAVDTWLDLAPLLGLDELVVLGDAVVADEPACLERMHRLVRGSRGIRGVVRARAALDLIRAGSASPRESLVRLLLQRAGLPSPELNVDVYDPHGQWLANVDFLWRRDRVILEYDGQVHTDPAQGRHDAQRRRQLVAAGWRVVVITKADVPDRMADVIADLRTLLG